MLKINNGRFELDGKKFNIYSGAIHYFRTLPEYWEDRLYKLKAAGFNTVETYVCWNLHEPKKGEFDFSGRLDIVRFLETAKKVGLYAIVRPGPYICAEWDFGGLPSWLLKDKNMQIRCNYPDYLAHVSDFYKVFLGKIDEMQITKGGNVIAMQVENEYGSFGNDKIYLEYVKNLMLDCGVNVLLFTSDGPMSNMVSGGALPDLYKVMNFGSGAKGAFGGLPSDNGPKMCGEFWCGWFDHWGAKHHTRGYKSVLKEINDFFDMDASFNVYMFHGGTNFGFTSGANCYLKYSPTVTSYDYCAFLTEWGELTPKYHAFRKLMLEKQGLKETDFPLPAPVKTQTIGEVKLTEFAALFDNLDNIGGKHTSAMPEGMEYYGQDFGYIYYETIMKGKYGMTPLLISDVHDIGYVYVDGVKKATINRMKNGIVQKLFGQKAIIMNGFDGERKIGVLVDAMGRVNYGDNMLDRKGISGIRIDVQKLMGYTVYTLPLNNLEKLKYKKAEVKCPAFLKGTFKASSKADCFVELKGFTKGCVFVNGFNLGRYWKIGPQQTLYIPGALLKENNEIVVFEQEGYVCPAITIIDTHKLG